MAVVALPAAAYFSNGSRTNAQAKSGQDDLLAFIRQSVAGTVAETTLTLATDSITPTGTVHAIETEGAAASDNCSTIAQTNTVDGQFLLVSAATAGHVVTLKNAGGGTGQLVLKNGVDTILDSVNKFVWFKRNGTNWEEVDRNYIDQRIISKSANYTVVAGDDGAIVKVDASGGAVTITMTAAATLGGNFHCTVIKTDSSDNAVTIDPTSTETVNGSTTYVLARQHQAAMMACDGVSDHRVMAAYTGSPTSWSGATTSIASAATMNLGLKQSNFLNATGTTTVTSLGSAATTANPIYFVRAASGFRLTHNATSLICPDGTSLDLQANDAFMAEALGSGNWRILEVFRAGGRRERLTANRTYYVRTDGANTNSGLNNSATSGTGAFLTLQGAIDFIRDYIDFNGFVVTIQMVAGTYTGSTTISGKMVGQKDETSLLIVGDVSTPSNVLLSVTSSNILFVIGGAMCSVSGVKVTTITSGTAFSTDWGSKLAINGAIEVGAIATVAFSANAGGVILIQANYTINGAQGQHFNIGYGGFIQCAGRTVTITGTPAITTAFLVMAGGFAYLVGTTWSGSATGPRYSIIQGAIANTGGQAITWLPGNAAHGTPTASNGLYV